MRTKQIDLKNDPIGKLMRHFIVASVLSMVVEALHSVIDSVFIGQYIGSVGLAAVNSTATIISWIWAFEVLFASGGCTLNAILLGEGEEEKACNMFYMTVVSAMTTVIIAAAVVMLFTQELCLLFGCTEEALPFGIPYIRIRMVFLVFDCFNTIMSRFVRNDANVKVVIYATAATTVVNILLKFVFLDGFGMKMAGAALATGIALASSSAVYLTHFLRPSSKLDLKLMRMKFSFHDFGHLFRTGIPFFFSESAWALTSIFLNRTLRSLGGTTAIAAMGTMFTIINFVWLVIYGVASAITPIIGYNHGAGETDRVMKTLRYGIFLGTLFGLIATAICALFCEEIVMVINNSEKDFIDMAVHATMINLTTMPITSVAHCVLSFYQAVDKSKTATVMTILKNTVFVIVMLFALVYGFNMGIEGVWWTYPVTDIMTLVMCLTAILITKRKYHAISRDEASAVNE
ncbi:MAG: MATE family efflux transporter [Eubacteriales bacterium]|nr:MATE family efflux transporter [Eubacteriales bacterium]